jgi:hypothetical protein
MAKAKSLVVPEPLVHGEYPWNFLERFFSWSLQASIIYCILFLVIGLMRRMIAVMTLNIGYFFAVLAGLFFGEFAFGRFISGSGLHAGGIH